MQLGQLKLESVMDCMMRRSTCLALPGIDDKCRCVCPAAPVELFNIKEFMNLFFEWWFVVGRAHPPVIVVPSTTLAGEWDVHRRAHSMYAIRIRANAELCAYYNMYYNSISQYRAVVTAVGRKGG